MSRVCAIVVTYHPDPRALENIQAVRRQVDRLIVVDNEATPESRARLEPLAADPQVVLVHFPDNRGVGAALNVGVRHVLTEGFDWLATFDQDSRIPADFVSGLLAGWGRFSKPERVAVLAPLYRDRYLGFVSSPAGPVEEPISGEVVIPVTATSGNLVSAQALREVGQFREDFFIDCLDFEFCLRCRQRGWLILEIRPVLLDHAQGRYELRRWLGRTPRINDYSAVRRYYQARNRLILYAHFATFDPRWILRDARGYLSDLAKLILFCERRPGKLRAVLTGWWHAIRGRRGRWVVTR